MTPTIIAKRPGQWLVKTSTTEGYILDSRGEHEPATIAAILARGYWEPSDDDVAAVRTALKAGQ